MIQIKLIVLFFFAGVSTSFSATCSEPLEHQSGLLDEINQVLQNPERTYIASRFLYVKPCLQASSGAFLIAQNEGKFLVLLGLRRGENQWVTLGGKSDYVQDQDIARTASRKIFEQSNRAFNIPDTILRTSPSHDLIQSDHIFRQYFLKVNYVDAQTILDSRATPTTNIIHEYEQFAWIPLEKFLDPKTLQTGIIDFQEMHFPLYRPFYDLLKTDQVLWKLKCFLTNDVKKCLEEQHTQSTLQNIQEAPKNAPNIHKYTTKASDLEREYQLGRSIIHKATLLRDIHKLPLIDPSSAERSISNLSYGSNNDANSLYSYTASEAHLKLWLKEKYSLIEQNDEESSLRKNILLASAHSPYRKVVESAYLQDTLVDVLMKERSFNPEWLALYHATQGEMSFLYDIITEIRQLLTGRFSEEIPSVRLDDNLFSELESVLDINHTDIGKKGDFEDRTRELAVNFFLFANPEHEGESTMFFFLTNTNMQPVNLERFLDSIESKLGGLKINIHRYTRLYESILGDMKENSRLYQFFVHPDYINSLVFSVLFARGKSLINYNLIRQILRKSNSLLAGEDKDLEYTDIRNCSGQIIKSQLPVNESNMPKGLIRILKKEPEIFERSFSVVHREKTSDDRNFLITGLEGRLLLQPECMNDPEKIKIFFYHRTENSKKNYDKWLQKLREYLADDISEWLQKKNQLEKGVLLHSETSTFSKKRFGSLYQDVTGESYKETENFKAKLSIAYSTEDQEKFKSLVRTYGVKKVFAEPFPNPNPIYGLYDMWGIPLAADIVSSNKEDLEFLFKLALLRDEKNKLSPLAVAEKILKTLWTKLTEPEKNQLAEATRSLIAQGPSYLCFVVGETLDGAEGTWLSALLLYPTQINSSEYYMDNIPNEYQQDFFASVRWKSFLYSLAQRKENRYSSKTIERLMKSPIDSLCSEFEDPSDIPHINALRKNFLKKFILRAKEENELSVEEKNHLVSELENILSKYAESTD